MLARRALGTQAEKSALSYLQNLGYLILRTNYFCRQGEIDIIAKEQDTLCFIEVRSKSTNDFGFALESILPKKKQRIIKAAKHFLFSFSKNQEIACRFDVIGFDYQNSPQITLIRNAFSIEE